MEKDHSSTRDLIDKSLRVKVLRTQYLKKTDAQRR
jgi:hypothetical protein